MTKLAWARLVPELIVTDLDRSLRFYIELLGFNLRFTRPEDRFAYIDREGAELMLEQTEAGWRTGALDLPYGRGVNFQIEVSNGHALAARLIRAGHPFFRPPAERWYRAGASENGHYEFLIQDPDGYLLRFAEFLGERPLSLDNETQSRRTAEGNPSST
ncbi:MAG: bleomycin resistance protein [Hyphomicrobiaceae bacterium]